MCAMDIGSSLAIFTFLGDNSYNLPAWIVVSELLMLCLCGTHINMALQPREPPKHQRILVFGPEPSSHPPEMLDNCICTAKYTLLSFPFLNLREQLQKRANVYFLFMALMMYLGENTCLWVASIKSWSTIGLLSAMMLLSASISACDDYFRHRSDHETNHGKQVMVWDVTAQRFVQTPWATVCCGEFVQVMQNEECPGDIILTASGRSDSAVFVSTLNLDGETNLKPKRIVNGYTTGSSGTIVRTEPSKDMYSFESSITHHTREEVDNVALEHVSLDSVMLRGTFLKNTPYVIGIVVEIGKNTRIQRNSRRAPMKIAHIEYIINRIMVLAILLQGCMALGTTLVYSWTKGYYDKLPYIFPGGYSDETCLPSGIAYFMTFFILYSNIIPISLYATMEVMNMAYTLFINSDPALKTILIDKSSTDRGTTIFAKARATNLAHELGQIRFVFSDKTGTLTKNIMTLKSVHINGKDLPSETKLTMGKSVTQDEFILCLLLNHTMERMENNLLQGESPEEDAFLKYLEPQGFSFERRTATSLLYSVKGNMHQVKIVTLNPFDSTRKCMSIILQEENRFVLYIKGADVALLDNAPAKVQFQPHVDKYSKLGLRALVLGYKEFALNDSSFHQWLAAYEKATRNLHDHDSLFKLRKQIEKDPIITGIVAIEDELQDDVGNSISHIKDAGLNFWVLTGDNPLTAEAIGYSTKVLNENMTILRCLDAESIYKLIKSENSQQRNRRMSESHSRALIVTGRALIELEEDYKANDFIPWTQTCGVVIACRVSPAQKAELVSLVKKYGCTDGAEMVTLAIGDGANDCPMIMEAHVGVGLYGKEGRQAANASDFSLGQFKLLERLFLVHGRWNYKRTAKVILFTFWRNAVQELMMCFYVFQSGISGTPLFEDKLRITFNAICTIPILAVGLFDKDMSAKTALINPEVYKVGRKGEDLNLSIMSQTLLHAILTACLLFGIVLELAPILETTNIADYYSICLVAYTALVLTCAVRVANITVTWNWCLVLFHGISLLMYAIFLVFYDRSTPSTAVWFTHGVPWNVFSHASSLVVVISCVLTFANIELLWAVFQHFINNGCRVASGNYAQPLSNTSNTSASGSSGGEDTDLERNSSGTSEDDIASAQHCCSQYQQGARTIWQQFSAQSLPRLQILDRHVGFKAMIILANSFLLTGVGMLLAYSYSAPTSERFEYTGNASYSFVANHERRYWVKYEIEPFYQNFNTWLQNPELSLNYQFQDTFQVASGANMTYENVCWTSDLSIIRSRYINTSSKKEMTIDYQTQLAAWMRPAAFARVTKRYGQLHSFTSPDDDFSHVTIDIMSFTDVESFGATKALIIESDGSNGKISIIAWAQMLLGMVGACFSLLVFKMCPESSPDCTQCADIATPFLSRNDPESTEDD